MASRYTSVEIEYEVDAVTINDASIVKDLNYTSNAWGTFDVNPTVTITFGSAHSLPGLSINFANENAKWIMVKWTIGGQLMVRLYQVKSVNCLIFQEVENCTGIVIEVISAKPYTKVDVKNVFYGIKFLWDSNCVKTANLVLETDRISERLSVNTLTFDIIDVGNDLDAGNTDGIYKYLKKRKKIIPHEHIDQRKIQLGNFFLESFNTEKNLCHITAVSYMGLFGSVQFDKGRMYNGERAANILHDIFAVMGISHYSIDLETAEQPLYGTIEPCSCRDALQKVLFACHSIIDSSNPEFIQISKSAIGSYGELTREQKFSTRVTRQDYVSGVKINYKHYSLALDTSEIVNEIYGDGTHHVTFSTPYSGYSITGATLVDSGLYYVEFTVSGSQQVVVTATAYESFEHSVQVQTADTGEDESIKEYSTTLCNNVTARTLAAKLLRYFSNQFSIQVKYLAEDVDTNKKLIIQNAVEDLTDYIGMCTSRTLDLTGGFIDDATYIGYYDNDSATYFLTNAGDDIIPDDNIIL